MQSKKLIKFISFFCLVVCFAVFLTGCTTAKVAFDREGAGSAVVMIAKEDGVTKQSVEQKIEKVIEGVKAQSQRERLTLKSVTEGDDYFEVEMDFKRISDTKGLGSYRYMTGKDFGAQRVERSLFNSYSKANKINSGFTNWNSSTFKPIEGYSAINPVLYESGEKLDPQSFVEPTNEYYTEDYIFFTYIACGLEGVTSIEFTFPGKIVFTSDVNLEVIDKDTVKVTPVKVQATETGVEEDGVTAFKKDGEYDAFIGYVVFELETDYTPFIVLGVIGVIIIGLIVAGFLTGAFKKFFKSRTWGHVKKHKILYLFVLPGFALLAVFNYAPMVGIIVAFKNYTVDNGILGSEWVGFDHFVTLFTHPGSEFWMILRNTVVMALLKFVFGFPASIILALMFNALANGIFKKTVQTISYLPYFVSWVVVSNIVYLFLSANGGIVNSWLKTPIRFYSEPKYWWAILTGTSVWKTVGWGTIVYLAAITGINPNLYEAASIDGASSWRKLWTVTIPGMMPVIGIQLILSAGNLIKDDFDQIFSMVGASNYELREVTEVFSSLVFRNLQGGPKGYSSSTAISLVQSVISLGMVLGANAIVKKTDNQGLW